MRAVLNPVLAVLIVAALFWGNCFSCPQVLLAQQKHKCCPHSKTTQSDCQTQVLKNFVKAEKGSVAAPAAAPTEIVPPASVLMQPALVAGERATVDCTPPLITSLRI